MHRPFIALVFLGASSTSISEDWALSNDGVLVNEEMAFPGCTATPYSSDGKALKSAKLKAQANIARSRSKIVSGHEQLNKNGYEENYKLTVYENSESFVNPIRVIDQKISVIDNHPQFCVLVVEDRMGTQ